MQAAAHPGFPSRQSREHSARGMLMSISSSWLNWTLCSTGVCVCVPECTYRCPQRSKDGTGIPGAGASQLGLPDVGGREWTQILWKSSKHFWAIFPAPNSTFDAWLLCSLNENYLQTHGEMLGLIESWQEPVKPVLPCSVRSCFSQTGLIWLETFITSGLHFVGVWFH